jgi:hypothetical protein
MDFPPSAFSAASPDQGDLAMLILIQTVISAEYPWINAKNPLGFAE